MKFGKVPAVVSAVLAASLVSGGCATKKHVREAIAPVQQQVNDVQKQTADNKTAIGDLDRAVATADEKATDAGKRANQAAEAAAAAQNSANQAGQKADAANQAAGQVQQSVSRLDSRVDKSFQNLDNYHLVDTKQVYFKSGVSNLDQDAQGQLDQAISAIGNMRNYVIEIEGFADHTGPRAYNVELSRRRAESVVRYLTVEHNVPLRSVRTLGIGADFPNAVNKTREDRHNNRRVDVKIYALDLTGAQGQAATDNPNGNSTADRARQVQH
ncbi:MAG: OmpA family protein [Acidobacteriaceae bacterium]|nr:OmpA family protein [Acidobacteriaceae bacterium]